MNEEVLTKPKPAKAGQSPIPSSIKAVSLYDPYGWMAKIGLVVPSTNTVNAHEWTLMAPEGISIHTARAMLLGHSTQESYDIMAKNTEKAAEELATAEVDIVAYGCTSGSFMCDRRQICKRLSELCNGVPATTTSDSFTAALRALGVKKVSMGTPYLDFVNQQEVKFLESEGFKVMKWHGLQMGESQAERRAINKIPPEGVFRLARKVDHPEAEAIFLSCTAMPTINVIAELEAELGKPVVTSNQSTFWNCLRTLGLKVKVYGYGRLLEEH